MFAFSALGWGYISQTRANFGIGGTRIEVTGSTGASIGTGALLRWSVKVGLAGGFEIRDKKPKSTEGGRDPRWCVFDLHLFLLSEPETLSCPYGD